VISRSVYGGTLTPIKSVSPDSGRTNGPATWAVMDARGPGLIQAVSPGQSTLEHRDPDANRCDWMLGSQRQRLPQGLCSPGDFTDRVEHGLPLTRSVLAPSVLPHE